MLTYNLKDKYTEKQFDSKKCYLKIILTKIISPEDLSSFLTEQGINLDKKITLIDDLPIENFSDKLEKLRVEKYPQIKSFEEIRILVDNFEKYDREELAKIYLQAPFDPLVEKTIEKSLNDKSNCLSREDLLSFFLEGFLMSV